MTDLRQLRALTAVIDEGTFTDAAIALRTSQASVSRAVAELERTLGVRLLLRTSLGARPTVLGRRVAEHARRVLAEIALIEGLAEQRPAVLRVGFAWSVFGRLTTPIQAQFPRPGIRYRPVVDAPPIAVWLVWWRDDPPAGASAFRQLVCQRYAE